MRRSSPTFLFLILLVAAALACNFADELLLEATPVPLAAMATAAVDQATITSEREQTEPESGASPTPNTAPEATEALPTAAPTAAEPALDSMASPAQQDSFERLAANDPPERDELELARLYGEWDGVLNPPAVVTEPLAVGAVQQLRVLNHDDITYSATPFELLAVSDHAYFWFSESLAADISAGVLQDTCREAVRPGPGGDGAGPHFTRPTLS